MTGFLWLSELGTLKLIRNKLNYNLGRLKVFTLKPVENQTLMVTLVPDRFIIKTFQFKTEIKSCNKHISTYISEIVKYYVEIHN